MKLFTSVENEFMRYFKGRVRSVIDKYGVKGKIAMALSGGKDSVAAFHVLHEMGFEIIPFHIHLGIDGYSDACMKYAEKISRQLGYKMEVVRLKDYGISLEKVRKKCSICGTAKRYLMNKFAFESNSDYVATGHNLSDMVTFAFNNLATGNILNFRGMKPVLDGNKKVKMVAKLKPLYYLKDNECQKYVELNELPYCDEKCPYQKDAPTIQIKNWIHSMEEKNPGIMKNFATSFQKIEEMMKNESEPRACRICGYPSYGKICKFCRLRRKYGKI